MLREKLKKTDNPRPLSSSEVSREIERQMFVFKHEAYKEISKIIQEKIDQEVITTLKGDIGPQGDSIKGQDGRNGKDGRNGNDGSDGINGKDGKNGSVDAPNEVVDKVNRATNKIKASQIDLDNVKGAFNQLKYYLGGHGGDTGGTELTATGSVNGVNATFTFTRKPDYIYSDHARYKENLGWTWSGLTATMTIPPTEEIYGIT